MIERNVIFIRDWFSRPAATDLVALLHETLRVDCHYTTRFSDVGPAELKTNAIFFFRFGHYLYEITYDLRTRSAFSTTRARRSSIIIFERKWRHGLPSINVRSTRQERNTYFIVRSKLKRVRFEIVNV